jgi:hypothetical protein
LESADHALEDCFAVGAAEHRFGGAFGVGHHTADVSVLVTDAGDVEEGAVGVGGFCEVAGGVGVLEQDLVIVLEGLEGGFIGEVAAFAVGDGDADGLVGWGLVGEGGVMVGGFEVDLFAAEGEVAVPDEGTWEEAGFAEDLEAVTDTEDEAAVLGELADGLHDGAESGDGAAAEVVAVAEAAGDEDGVDIAEAMFLMPDVFGVLAELAQGMDGILVAIGCGELEDGELVGVHSMVRW